MLRRRVIVEVAKRLKQVNKPISSKVEIQGIPDCNGLIPFFRRMRCMLIHYLQNRLKRRRRTSSPGEDRFAHRSSKKNGKAQNPTFQEYAGCIEMELARTG